MGLIPSSFLGAVVGTVDLPVSPCFYNPEPSWSRAGSRCYCTDRGFVFLWFARTKCGVPERLRRNASKRSETRDGLPWMHRGDTLGRGDELRDAPEQCGVGDGGARHGCSFCHGELLQAMQLAEEREDRGMRSVAHGEARRGSTAAGHRETQGC